MIYASFPTPDVDLDRLSLGIAGPRWRAGVGAVTSLVGVAILVLGGYLAASVLVPGLVDAFGNKYVVGGLVVLYWTVNLAQVVDRYVDERSAELQGG